MKRASHLWLWVGNWGPRICNLKNTIQLRICLSHINLCTKFFELGQWTNRALYAYHKCAPYQIHVNFSLFQHQKFKFIHIKCLLFEFKFWIISNCTLLYIYRCWSLYNFVNVFWNMECLKTSINCSCTLSHLI